LKYLYKFWHNIKNPHYTLLFFIYFMGIFTIIK